MRTLDLLKSGETGPIPGDTMLLWLRLTEGICCGGVVKLGVRSEKSERQTPYETAGS